MSKNVQEFDVVALLRDIPEKNLVQGQVGTVVEKLEESIFEVEFSDDEGRAYAMLAVAEADLIILHYSQVKAA